MNIRLSESMTRFPNGMITRGNSQVYPYARLDAAFPGEFANSLRSFVTFTQKSQHHTVATSKSNERTI